MYYKIEICFDINGIDYVKFVFRGLKFVFSDFFSLQIKLLLCHHSNLKNWLPLQWLKKKFRTKQKNHIPSKKMIFKEEGLKLIISFNLSNKSRRTFMQKSTDQRPFDFFQIWYQKSICLFINLCCINLCCQSSYQLKLLTVISFTFYNEAYGI